MQCGVEERTIRRQETVVVECFKYREKGHKCREYPLWRKAKEERRLRRVGEERAAHVRAHSVRHQSHCNIIEQAS